MAWRTPQRNRWLLLGALAALAALLAPGAIAQGWRGLYDRRLVRPLHREAVILIVLDNVRADRLALCGYDRPTSPNLTALAEKGVSSCHAYAPGTWTLPSHASFFTGLPMLEHGAHELPLDQADASSPLAPGTSIPIRGLEDRFPTLAEQMAAAGFQTGLVSANPVLGPASGLTRGFAHTLVAKAFGDLDGAAVTHGVNTMMDTRLDPLGGPLFLTVNLADAHQPWAAVPEGVGWLPSRPALTYLGEAFTRVWMPFYNGTMGEADRAAFLAQLGDVYDYGVWRADRALGDVLDAVKTRGWCGGGCRVLVVSDHGELLGEHGLIDHGFYPWEENARVPLVAVGFDLTALPEPISASAVFSLALHGELPSPLGLPAQASFGHTKRAEATMGRFYAERSAAVWQDDMKWIWISGRRARFDLGVDPGEIHALSPDPEPALFTTLREQVKVFQAEAVLDEALRLQLEAAGYLEPEKP